MEDLPVYEVLAQAFAAEGVDTVFALMGDANMYWITAMANKQSAQVVHARHEHAAVAMAHGYARRTGKVGVATVTCGPGYTQIMTALTSAARGRIPLVVFAGDTPTSDLWHLQQIDQKPLAEATGARFVRLENIDRMLHDLREAFYLAQFERLPVVLSVPMDLQARTFPWTPEHMPSSAVLPEAQRIHPDPAIVAKAVDMIKASQKPIILAGEGAVMAGAGEALEALGDKIGALLGNSVRAKGLFEGRRFDIGTAGSFASDVARELFAEADLVIGVGATLGQFTTEAGYLYPNAKVIQIDTNPRGLWQGLRIADLHIRADARVAAEALAKAVDAAGVSGKERYRTAEVRQRLESSGNDDTKPFDLKPREIDPRSAMQALSRLVPPDWDVVLSCGHFWLFSPHLSGRRPERYHFMYDFGAIAQGLSAAIGMAAARNDGKLLLIEGDGSLLMHIQELETAARHRLQMLICVLNDGAYAAEVHKLVAYDVDASQAEFGRPDLAAVAKAFGLRGETVTDLSSVDRLFAEHSRAGTSSLWDMHVAGHIPSKMFRRLYFGEH